MRLIRFAVLLPVLAALGGCDFVVMSPAGDVARQQAGLVTVSTLLMLLIILPVMALTVIFAWRYRASNARANYEPDWDHSTQLELIIWTVPLLIIICLGAVTWMGTHLLDPYRPVGRISEAKAVTKATKPLRVEVVSLDWKWLFIYPEEKIATVNVLAAPVDRPISFEMTSSSVMNSFYIPALAGQIYTMPGMQTTLHAVINEPGTYKGFSANYSGAGFSKMRFDFIAMNDADFAKWVDKAKAAKTTLDRAAYTGLAKPSEGVKPVFFGSVEDGLYHAILNRCVEAGKMCLDKMMAMDMHGGADLPLGARVVGEAASPSGKARVGFVPSLCTVAEARALGFPSWRDTPRPFGDRLRGVGLPRRDAVSYSPAADASADRALQPHI